MNSPEELQQIDALNSVTINPFEDSIQRVVFSNDITSGWFDGVRDFWLLLPDFAVLVMIKFFTFFFFFTLILAVLIIWLSNEINQLQKKMSDRLLEVSDNREGHSSGVVNEKWEKVIIHINSENPSDWKLAILECDIMLGDILEKMGYLQNSIGEKLKAVDPKDFKNIESAWEAHKIRNAVAHEGSEFVISHREAKRVIGLYEVVFREFDFI